MQSLTGRLERYLECVSEIYKTQKDDDGSVKGLGGKGASRCKETIPLDLSQQCCLSRGRRGTATRMAVGKQQYATCGANAAPALG